jgi:two-component system cell cycle response regulator DivK
MKETILVVDTDARNRIVLQRVLRYHGFNVLEAEDGATGVNMAREYCPSLILMDSQMPVINGMETGKLLRADPRTKDIKLVAISGIDKPDDNFLATVFDGYIDKPFNILELPKIIIKHLQESQRGCQLGRGDH